MNQKRFFFQQKIWIVLYCDNILCPDSNAVFIWYTNHFVNISEETERLNPFLNKAASILHIS